MRRMKVWGPALLLVAPSLLLLAVFVYGFIAWNIRVSFTSWRGLTPRYDFVGTTNYRALAEDERFKLDVRNVAIFTGVFVGGSLLLGFGMATLLERGVRGEVLFRSIYLFPMAISFIATAIIWRWLLDNGRGEATAGLNRLLMDFGLGSLRSDWFRSYSPWAVSAIALPAGWAL